MRKSSFAPVLPLVTEPSAASLNVRLEASSPPNPPTKMQPRRKVDPSDREHLLTILRPLADELRPRSPSARLPQRLTAQLEQRSKYNSSFLEFRQAYIVHLFSECMIINQDKGTKFESSRSQQRILPFCRRSQYCREASPIVVGIENPTD
jgi:hypothetical protein